MMDKNKKIEHMLALTEEVNILTQRLKPTTTGYIHTTINTLRDRIEELKEELKDKSPNFKSPNFMWGSEGLDGAYSNDEIEEWDEMLKEKKDDMNESKKEYPKYSDFT